MPFSPLDPKLRKALDDYTAKKDKEGEQQSGAQIDRPLCVWMRTTHQTNRTRRWLMPCLHWRTVASD